MPGAVVDEGRGNAGHCHGREEVLPHAAPALDPRDIAQADREPFGRTLNGDGIRAHGVQPSPDFGRALASAHTAQGDHDPLTRRDGARRNLSAGDRAALRPKPGRRAENQQETCQQTRKAARHLISPERGRLTLFSSLSSRNALRERAARCAGRGLPQSRPSSPHPRFRRQRRYHAHQHRILRHLKLRTTGRQSGGRDSRDLPQGRGVAAAQRRGPVRGVRQRHGGLRKVNTRPACPAGRSAGPHSAHFPRWVTFFSF